jgi:hypothetical protein
MKTPVNVRYRTMVYDKNMLCGKIGVRACCTCRPVRNPSGVRPVFLSLCRAIKRCAAFYNRRKVVLNTTGGQALGYQSNQSNQSSKIESFDYKLPNYVYFCRLQQGFNRRHINLTHFIIFQYSYEPVCNWR